MAYFLRNGPGDFWGLYLGPTPISASDRLLSPQGRAALAFCRAHEQSQFFWVKGKGHQHVLLGNPEMARIFKTTSRTPPSEAVGLPSIDFYCPESLENGWITPDGVFYPVGAGRHMPFVEQVLNGNSRTTEGWIHFNPEFWHLNKNSADRHIIIPPTKVQRKMLERIGRSADNVNSPYNASIKFSDVVPGWNNRKIELQSKIAKVDTRIYDGRELSVQEKQELLIGLKRVVKLERAKRLWFTQREDWPGDRDIPALGLANLQRHRMRIEKNLGLWLKS